MQIVKRAEVRIEGKEGTNKNLFTLTLTLTITTTTIFHFQRIQRKNIKEPQKNYPPQYTKLLSRQRRRQTAKYQQQQKQQQLNIPSRFCGEKGTKNRPTPMCTLYTEQAKRAVDFYYPFR